VIFKEKVMLYGSGEAVVLCVVTDAHPPVALEGFAEPLVAGLALEAALELAGVFVGEGD